MDGGQELRRHRRLRPLADDGGWVVAGLRLQTRLNGEAVQSASTDDLVFDVATLVSVLSEAFSLEAGAVTVTGTPSGVGLARKPPLWMKPGDICEVELEGIGTLRTPVADQGAARVESAAHVVA